MTVLVVVLLEVIDIEIDASPLALLLRLALARDGVQIAAVVTAGERVTDAQFEELCL